MSVKMCLSVATIYTLSILPATAFDIGEDASLAMSRSIHGIVFADLLTGDKMRVSGNSFCVDDSKYMIFGNAVPVERSTYSAEHIVTVVAGSAVELTISTDHLDNPDRADISLSLVDCSIIQGTNFYRIESINGLTTLEAYLSSDFVTKLPTP